MGLSEFIACRVRSRELAPKTANRYREILHRLFASAMDERRVRMPSDRNPVAKVERYKERAPEIRFLTLQQIEVQLQALAFKPRLKAMVAVLIYAGLRREELLWLTADDMDKRTGPYGMIRVRAKAIDGQSWQPKTKVNRAVPISRTLRAYLDAYGFRPTSDVDMLVEFYPGLTPSLLDFAGMQLELSAIVGREVQLHTPPMLSRTFRHEVLREARTWSPMPCSASAALHLPSVSRYSLRCGYPEDAGEQR